ncbi:hypothetical protein ABEB36_004620 [Hypothenemus hampei]|uniref:BESS domain-containing protein n=1 Tax=Hypothenemus hampei TaxID=57062 RepID=A0ABD1F3Z2_HYPHA
MREERERRLECDSDRLFLLSLLPDFKKIPEYRRLSIKMEPIRVIKRNQELAIPFNHTTIRENEQNTHGYARPADHIKVIQAHMRVSPAVTDILMISNNSLNDCTDILV